jgi:hypothetical protein
LIAALLSLPAWAFGGTSCKPRLKTRGSKVTLEIERVAATQRATFTGVVREGGVALPGVTVKVRDEVTNQETAVVTNAKGAFTIAVNDGVYRVDVTLAGFVPAAIEHLALTAGEVAHASVALRTDSTVVITMGATAPVITMDASTTRISQDILNKLPF